MGARASSPSHRRAMLREARRAGDVRKIVRGGYLFCACGCPHPALPPIPVSTGRGKGRFRRTEPALTLNRPFQLLIGVQEGIDLGRRLGALGGDTNGLQRFRNRDEGFGTQRERSLNSARAAIWPSRGPPAISNTCSMTTWDSSQHRMRSLRRKAWKGRNSRRKRMVMALAIGVQPLFKAARQRPERSMASRRPDPLASDSGRCSCER